MTRAPRSKVEQRPRSIDWSERALQDLQAIDEFITADAPLAAERWVGKLIAAAEAPAAAPLAGRSLPETERADVREVFVRTNRIVYRVYAERIGVLTVAEGSERFPDLGDDD